MEEPQRDTLFHSSNFYLKINRAPGFSDAPDEIAVKAQIEINNEAIEYCDNLKVVVAGQELKLRNQQALQQIISFVDQNASSLIEFAIRDPFETIFPTQKGASSIEFKHYGLNLDFKYNFGTKNTEACDKFIDGIIKIIGGAQTSSKRKMSSKNTASYIMIDLVNGHTCRQTVVAQSV